MGICDRLFQLKDRVAIVTGSSSGLGVTFAKGLAEAGAHVVLAARRKERLDAIALEIEAMGSKVLAVECDITREEDVERLVAVTLRKFDRLDVLVNNAGMTHVVAAENESREMFQQVLDVNVSGAFACARICGKVMLKAGSGSIINIASIMGVVGIGLVPQAAYNASKGAVVNLTRELAAQWARRGVRVNAIAPGWFPSEMTDELFENEEGHKFIRKRTPMGRAGLPEELLGPMLLLASDASSYMTGQTIIVDGGWTIV
jgi:NAD(P)-dependent dehydrogenase (short-subunit alcohol dehydrogenase family)